MPATRGKVRARKFTDVRDVKKSLKKGGMGDLLVIQDEGVNVRFMAEPNSWVEYFEHYDEANSRYEICYEGDPYCEDGDRPSKRYLANVLDRDNKNKVCALKMTKTCADSVMRKYERYKTLLDRDYSITRDGTGFDTRYDVNPEGQGKVHMARYTPLDLWGIVEGMGGNDDYDEDDEEEDDEETPSRTARRSAKPVRGVKRRPTIADEDDEEEAPPRRRAPSSGRRTAVKPRSIQRGSTTKGVRKAIKRR